MKKGTITIRYMQEYLKHKQGQIDQTHDTKMCYIKLAEELGELARAMLRGERCATGPDDLKDSVNEELFDILYYVLSFANAKGIDMETWIPIKEEINNKRYPSGIEFNPADESWFESETGMKPVCLSADGPISIYMVPEEVADHLQQYCHEFLDWLHESPEAEEYRIASPYGVGYSFDHRDFLLYLNKYRFPKRPSSLLHDIIEESEPIYIYNRIDLPAKYRTLPHFNF